MLGLLAMQQPPQLPVRFAHMWRSSAPPPSSPLPRPPLPACPGCRYAGLLWTKPEKWDKIDTKGIETVRRDNCLLVRAAGGRRLQSGHLGCCCRGIPSLPAPCSCCTLLPRHLHVALFRLSVVLPLAHHAIAHPAASAPHCHPGQVRNVVTTCLEKILVERAPGQAAE